MLIEMQLGDDRTLEIDVKGDVPSLWSIEDAQNVEVLYSLGLKLIIFFVN